MDMIDELEEVDELDYSESATKQRIINWVETLDDVTTLDMLAELVDIATNPAYQQPLPEAAYLAIEIGLKDIEMGRVKPWEEVRKSCEKWLK